MDVHFLLRTISGLCLIVLLLFDFANCQFLNQPCYSNADCSPLHSRCNRTRGAPKGVCLCLPGYAAVDQKNCSRAQSPLKAAPISSLVAANSVIGKMCSQNSDCSGDPNASCQRTPLLCKAPISFCACKQGFIADLGRCKKPASFGQPCDAATACTDPRTVCNPLTSLCTCDSVSRVQPDVNTRCVSARAMSDYGQSCSEDGDCFDDFECVNDECTCKVGQRYDSTERRCIPNDIGDECGEHGDCFMIKFSICSSETDTCDCLPQYNRSVVSIGGMPKTVCLPIPKTTRQLGETCDDDENTMVRNFCRPPFVCLSCTPDGSSKVCAMPPLGPEATTMPPTSTVVTIRTTTTKSRKNGLLLDDDCEASEQCTGTKNAVCDVGNSFTCICDKGYIREDDDTCTAPNDKPAKPLGGALGADCEMDEDCKQIKNAICDPYTQSPTCICDDGYSPVGTNFCKPILSTTASTTTTKPPKITTRTTEEPLQIGDSCEDDIDCHTIENAFCDDAGECTCHNGFVNSGTSKCIPFIMSTPAPTCKNNACDLGAKCRPGFDTCNADGAVCLDGICQCPSGTKPGYKNDCIDIRRNSRLNGQCEDSRDCLYGLICQTYKCRCYSGYKAIGEFDCEKRQIGDPCTYDNDCRYVKYGVCLRHKCDCDMGYVSKSSSECAVSVWIEAVQDDHRALSCFTDADCYGPGVPLYSICGSKKLCECPKNAELDNNSNRCKFQIATDFTGWACTYNSDCGDGYICQMNQCRKPPPKKIVSRASQRSTSRLNNLFLIVALTIILFLS